MADNSHPLVSVAVITYNMEQYLHQLLDSILSQNVNFSYEIVIDDDCSPDNSREIIKEYQKKYPIIFRPIFRDTNVGGSRNMYGVMNHCLGKYIAILEGDDYWEDINKLQYQADFMESHPEYIGMCCNSWCDHGIEAEYRDVMRNRKKEKIFTIKDFLHERHFHGRLPSSTDTWFFRNFWKDGGDYSLFYKAHPMVWDQSLALILLGKGKFYASPKLVSHHRSVTKKDGTNYQSMIIQKNVLYEDSMMYQCHETYIRDVLNEELGDFRLVRGDVYVDALFRAVLSKKQSDRFVVNKIWKDQKNKGLLLNLVMKKTITVLGHKLKLC